MDIIVGISSRGNNGSIGYILKVRSVSTSNYKFRTWYITRMVMYSISGLSKL